MSIKDELTKTASYLRNARKAIINRGGEISLTAGLKDLPNAISNIPHDVTLAYQTDDSMTYRKTILENAERFVRINKIGGMTYRTEVENIISFPFGTENITTKNGITFTPNNDGSFTLSGEATSNVKFTLRNGDRYNYLTLNGIYSFSLSNLLPDGAEIYMNTTHGMHEFSPPVLISSNEYYRSQEFSGPYYGLIIISIPKGTICDGTIRYYPIFNKGMPASPSGRILLDIPVTELKSQSINGEIIDTLGIAPEIQAIEGYGRGINVDYYNYIDYDRKVFVQNTYRKVIDGTEKWNAQLLGGLGAKGKYRFRYYPDVEVMPVNNSNSKGNILCNIYETGSTNDTFDGKTMISNSSKSECLFIFDEEFSEGDIKTEVIDRWKAHLAELYEKGTPLIIEFALLEPIETDISKYITDEFIEVEGGGTITTINDYECDTPLTITYLIETVGG